MAVTEQHADYSANISRWQQYRDASAGEYAVKQRGESYLPRKSTHQTNAEYSAYKQRAMYFNATGRTVDGLVGLMFRRDPDMTSPDSMEPLLEDVTQDGVSFDELVKHVAEDVVTVGRGGVLVDFPTVAGVDNMRDYDRSGARPYATFYPAESITNWDTAYIGGRIVPAMVVLKETYSTIDPGDEFKKIVKDQYRVLDLDGGKYRQRVFRKMFQDNGKGESWVVVEEFWPKMVGKPMDYIPFEFFGSIDGRAKVQKSPIADIATVNLSHYRTLADLENGRHWCGSPTPVFIGSFESESGDEVTEIRLGSEDGIHMSMGSDAKFLEFAGTGLEELRQADAQKREMMAVLGSRILAPEKKQVEAAETARIHRAGEESTLQSIAHSVSKSATRVLAYLRDWSGASGDVSVEINTDFVPTEMTPEELTSTVMAWQSGAFSTQELFDRLKQGEMIRADKSYEDHAAELEEEGPKLGTLGGFE
jgi:hypothetical protein